MAMINKKQVIGAVLLVLAVWAGVHGLPKLLDKFGKKG